MSALTRMSITLTILVLLQEAPELASDVFYRLHVQEPAEMNPFEEKVHEQAMDERHGMQLVGILQHLLKEPEVLDVLLEILGLQVKDFGLE